MLELIKILRDIDALGRDRAELLRGLASELHAADDVINRIGQDLDAANRKIELAKTSWLVTTFDEPPGTAHDLPALPREHAVAAVDGSQIMPGKHEVTFCYLLNSAYIILYYGTGERPIARTDPQLFYSEEDLTVKPYGGQQVRVSERIVSIRRTLAEARAMRTAVETSKASGVPVVGMWDGSLIQWTFESEPPDFKASIIAEFLEPLDKGRELGIPIAGYISDPGSRDCVNAMRIILCDQDPVNCDKCPHADSKPCEALGHLKDSMVFNLKLADGQRSGLFTSSSSVLSSYGEHRIRAFCLNVGKEIVRVEVPEWVAADTSLVELTHSVSYDQAQKGRGYPVALAQAHEHAVVSGQDKRAFFELVERSFAKHGVRISLSLKRQSKGY